jgi:hypothetical protein
MTKIFGPLIAITSRAGGRIGFSASAEDELLSRDLLFIGNNFLDLVVFYFKGFDFSFLQKNDPIVN